MSQLDRQLDPAALARESEQWEADGLITTEQRRAILARYPTDTDAQVSSRALVWLAWLVAGFGLILLVAWNWADLPGPVKVGGTIVVTVGLYLAAWQAWTQSNVRRAEWLAFGGALAAGSIMAAVTEVNNIPLETGWPLFAWAGVVAVTAAVVASPIIIALGTCLLTFWAMTQTGEPPAPWAFLIFFPVLAFAVERKPHVYAAGTVTLALGTWVTLVGLDSWKGAASVPGVMALAAAAALDAWSHAPVDRRPAFARTTPALALAVAGLWFLGMSGLNRTTVPVLLESPTDGWPGLVLLAALVLVAVWPSSAQRDARRRPLVFGALVAIWIVAAVIAPGARPAPSWMLWFWTIVSSVALIMVTVTAVREGVDTHNRALFVVGVAAIVALVVMHVANDNADFGRSAVVLFAAAAVLWWVSRALRHKPDPQTP